MIICLHDFSKAATPVTKREIHKRLVINVSVTIRIPHRPSFPFVAFFPACPSNTTGAENNQVNPKKMHQNKQAFSCNTHTVHYHRHPRCNVLLLQPKIQTTRKQNSNSVENGMFRFQIVLLQDTAKTVAKSRSRKEFRL